MSSEARITPPMSKGPLTTLLTEYHEIKDVKSKSKNPRIKPFFRGRLRIKSVRSSGPANPAVAQSQRPLEKGNTASPERKKSIVGIHFQYEAKNLKVEYKLLGGKYD